MSEDLHALPVRERAARYRELAAQARKDAESPALIEEQHGFVRIAEAWERMARELEEAIGNER